MQNALRTAFTRWGVCDRLQTDREARLVSSRRYPFPSRFLLWLVGLGIAHECAPSAPANGCVERFHRTCYARVVRGSVFTDLAHLQACLNQQLPSRGRACQGQPPLQAYPQARSPRHPFHPAAELELFSLQRVYAFLAPQFWWRSVSQVGQVFLAGQRYSVGQALVHQGVKFTFDPLRRPLVVTDTQEVEIKRLQPPNLTVEAITGLPTTPT